MTSPPPGWYPEPDNPAQLRWWDGTAWGAQVSPNPQTPPLAEVQPPDMQALAEQAAQQAAQQANQPTAPVAAVYHPAAQATEPYTPVHHTTPSVLWTGMISVLVTFMVAIILGVAGGILIALGLLGGAGGAGIMLTIFMVLAVVGQLWLTGNLAAYFFERRGFHYTSKWNLVAGFILASVAFSAASFLISLLLALLVGNSSGQGGAGVSLILLLAMIPLYIYLSGKIINLAVTWSESSGKIITIIAGAASLLLVAIVSLTLGAAIIALQDAAKQSPQALPQAPEMRQQLEDQLREQGVPEEQRQQLLERLQNQQSQ